MKLGRRARAHRPEVPHLSALLAGKPLTPPPISRDWTDKMPEDFGMMLNDQLGDCTCAAYYHACQIWSFNTGGEITAPDAAVEKLYEEVGGYIPGKPDTDQGAVEQDVLTYLLKQKDIDAFVEVDPRNMDDIKRVINDCGAAYIGIQCPERIVDDLPAKWDYVTGDDKSIAGGHAIILVGYDLDGFWLISWGKKYYMTFAFFANFCDEAYAIADPTWLRIRNFAPCGLTLEQLEQQMKALRDAE